MRFGQKVCIYGEGGGVNQVFDSWGSARGIFVGGPDDFHGAIPFNPEILKCANTGVKPEANPLTTESCSIFLFDGWPVVCHQHDVCNLPLGQLASMPQPRGVSFPDGVNKIRNINKFEVFADDAVMFFPVQKETATDSLGLIRIGFRFIQKTVPVIRCVAQRTRCRGYALGCGHMGKNATRMRRSVTSPYEHGLFARRTAGAKGCALTKFLPELLRRYGDIPLWMKRFFHVVADYIDSPFYHARSDGLCRNSRLSQCVEHHLKIGMVLS